MNDVRCPRCGASVPPNAAFCGMCGAPVIAPPPAAEQPAEQPTPPPADSSPAQGWQQVPGNQPAANLPVPTAGYFPPPGVGPKFLGDNTKWALGLGAASLFCCGPIT